jgi:hypothetical protein
MPGARCTRSLVCEMKKHTSIVTTVTPERPGIPRAMVLRFPSCSPRRPGLLPPSLPGAFGFPGSLMSASGHQAHTTLPSALRAFVLHGKAAIASRTQR